MKSGIYVILNKKNDKVYIGSTKDFGIRWGLHRSSLRRNKHGNSHLQYSWNKYGEDAFEFGVLEYLDNLEELVKAEQFWIDIYREEGKELYNCGLVADSPRRGCKHSEESKQRIREARKDQTPPMLGHKHSRESKCKMSESAKHRPSMSKEFRLKITEERACAAQWKKDISFPALINKGMDEVIQAGTNLGVLCEKWGLDYYSVLALMRREVSSHRGWELLVNPRPSKRDRNYPAFVHMETGEIIPAGFNLAKMCKERGLGDMGAVKRGEVDSYYGWRLIEV